ncbi:MAG: hypothetical protein NTW03_01800 [Verrucomicrobia bacterium]|nr:hypothetical protein [Verrucomicrobiota bacterium]
MKKNGTYFLSVVAPDALQAGVWNPYAYREEVQSETLDHFASVQKVQGRFSRVGGFKYLPIEYRHIHRGTIPVFTLELASGTTAERVPVVGESCLLFGTMRAYLGNTLVTPKASWLGGTSPLLFPVKSEFVQIIPKDGLTYFWWTFLQSPKFLQSLPIGSGGTRPRLDRELLLRTAVEVPVQSVREKIHRCLSGCAERAWRDYVEAEELLNSTIR